jgi:hypothetical protein
MSPKIKALLLNFMGFAILFLVARIVFGYLFNIDRLYLALGAAIIASILAPKFAVVEVDGSSKILMKWIFIKGLREI